MHVRSFGEACLSSPEFCAVGKRDGGFPDGAAARLVVAAGKPDNPNSTFEKSYLVPLGNPQTHV